MTSVRPSVEMHAQPIWPTIADLERVERARRSLLAVTFSVNNLMDCSIANLLFMPSL